MIDHLGLLAAHQLGQLGFIPLDQVERLDPHRLPQVRQLLRPAARSRQTDHQIALGNQVLGQMPAHKPGDPRHQRTHGRLPSPGLTEVNVFVEIAIGPRADAFDPIGVGLVPRDGGGQSFLEGDGGAPAQLGFGLGAVDGVAAVVSQAVGDVVDQGLGLTAELQDGAGHVDVVSFALAAEVVDLAARPRRRAASIPRQWSST